MTIKPRRIGNNMSLSIRNFLVIIMLITSTFAQAEIKASIDRQVMYLGESLTLTIASDKSTNSQPDFTVLDAVFHVGQTGKSSSTQIINGQVSTQTTWQVLLVPKSLGSHIIPPLEVDGESSQALKIEVNKPDPDAQANGDIFIEIEADKTSAYVQEEILLTVRLLYAINLKNGALTDPVADGVIVQQINKGANYTTQRNGKTYQVLERKYAIFAENSGKMSLNPLVFEGEVTDNSRQSFGMFQRGRPVRQVSQMIDFEIKQIPQAFVSQAWIPAKQVTLQQSWSQNKPYQVGEPITRTINLTAIGLSETQLPDLSFEDINGAKLYQDKTDTMTRTDGQQLISSKVIKYAVIPTVEGTLEVPEFSLEWFDTKSQSAKTVRIPATSLAIKPADGSTTQVPTAIDFNPPTTEAHTPSDIDHVPAEISHQLKWWKVSTFLFGGLWLLTLFYVFLKPNGRITEAVEVKPQLRQISLRNINQASLVEVQSKLISWWNEEYQQKHTNLGQIRDQLKAGPMKQAITDLQKQMYTDDQCKIDVDWLQLIKQGQFKPENSVVKTSAGLPELYS